MKRSYVEEGSANPLVISNVLLAILVIAFGTAMVWAYTNYQDQKNNVDAKVGVAVAAARKDQSTTDEKEFLEREKAPYEQFIGPDDLGRVSFNYPKTWSVYRAKTDGSAMQAYFHPGVVPAVQSGQQFALELKVLDQSSDQILKGYEALIKKGDLKSTQVTVNGFSGVRLDGAFTKNIKGSLVLFKVRDKTLSIMTDAETFRTDFDEIVLKSLDFNP